MRFIFSIALNIYSRKFNQILENKMKDFWEDWKRKTKIELKGIEVVKKARQLILNNIPKEEILAIYCKGSFVTREMNSSIGKKSSQST